MVISCKYFGDAFTLIYGLFYKKAVTQSVGRGVIDREILNSHSSEGRRIYKRRIETKYFRNIKIKLSNLKQIFKGLLRW